MGEFPTPDVEVTHLFVVSDMERSRSFYRDVLGVEVFREYGGTSCVLKFQDTWLLLVTGGGPTKDKPTVIIAHTIKGKGVSFMENNPKFHGAAPTREEADKALLELA